jgi:hypothetical protein
MNKIIVTLHTHELLHNHIEIHIQRHGIYFGNPKGKTKFEWLFSLFQQSLVYNATNGPLCIPISLVKIPFESEDNIRNRES